MRGELQEIVKLISVPAPNFWLHLQKTVNYRKADGLLSLRHGSPSRCDAGGGLQGRKLAADMLNKQSRLGQMLSGD